MLINPNSPVKTSPLNCRSFIEALKPGTVFRHTAFTRERYLRTTAGAVHLLTGRVYSVNDWGGEPVTTLYLAEVPGAVFFDSDPR